MNTRLQVEHPVTEMVTGLDLVALQFLVASGQPLPFSQDDVTWTGHAIEARINAEDPAERRLVPTPGRITRLHAPSGPWVRTDAGYETGDVVDQHYDNLMAKVVAWGPDRESARRRLLRALHETEVEGVAHDGARAPGRAGPPRLHLGVPLDYLAGSVRRPLVHRAAPDRRRPAPRPRSARTSRSKWQAGAYDVSVWVPPQRPTGLPGRGARPGGSSGGPAGGDRRRGPGAPAAEVQVTVPMQGTVVKVLVKLGDTVEAGQTVCVLEAMKMENNIVTETAGTVAEVRVEAGRRSAAATSSPSQRLPGPQA